MDGYHIPQAGDQVHKKPPLVPSFPPHHVCSCHGFSSIIDSRKRGNVDSEQGSLAGDSQEIASSKNAVSQTEGSKVGSQAGFHVYWSPIA